jgi:hypothetical protein
MRRMPLLIPLSVFAAAILCTATGCSSQPSASSQAQQAMYSAASQPVQPGSSLAGRPLRAGQKWANLPAHSLRMAVPDRWVVIRSPATLRRALRQVGLGQASAAQLAALVPGSGSATSVELADPDPHAGQGANARFQALISLNCTADDFPAGTDPATGLTTIAESDFTALNANSAQMGQTSVDGRTALLIFDQASVGGKTVTGLQYAISAPGGRACYVALVTESPLRYEPVFSQLRPGILVNP